MIKQLENTKIEMPTELVQRIKRYLKKGNKISPRFCKTEISDQVQCGYQLELLCNSQQEAQNLANVISDIVDLFESIQVPNFQI